MKRIFVFLMVTVFFSVAGSVAMAGSVQTNVSVSANILGTCLFDSTPTFDFGSLDLTVTSDATANGNLVFWCTNGTGYTLGDEANPAVGDGAFTGNLVSGGNLLPYTMSYTNFSGTGSGKTSPKTSVLTLTILNSDYVDAAPGLYTDTVTFTLTF